MTRRVGNTIYLEGEPDGTCELCGDVTELRPAGPNQEHVCLPCANKDPAAKQAYMDRLADGLDAFVVVSEPPSSN